MPENGKVSAIQPAQRARRKRARAILGNFIIAAPPLCFHYQWIVRIELRRSCL